MHLASVLLLAVGLALDATAVAAARGLAARELRPAHAVIVAAWFGGAQAVMPLVGAGVGTAVGLWISPWAHWIAAVILAVLGAKMIADASRAATDEPDRDEAAPFGPRIMLPLAIATSIDALAVGVTLPLLDAPIGLSIATIGVVTGILSATGLYVGHHGGRRLGAMLGARLDRLGGVVLIGMAGWILLEHLFG